MQPHQGMKVTHFDASNLIYHKFSQGAVSYRLIGENVNVMLELCINIVTTDKTMETLLN